MKIDLLNRWVESWRFPRVDMFSGRRSGTKEQRQPRFIRVSIRTVECAGKIHSRDRSYEYFPGVRETINAITFYVRPQTWNGNHSVVTSVLIWHPFRFVCSFHVFSKSMNLKLVIWNIRVILDSRQLFDLLRPRSTFRSVETSVNFSTSLWYLCLILIFVLEYVVNPSVGHSRWSIEVRSRAVRHDVSSLK